MSGFIRRFIAIAALLLAGFVSPIGLRADEKAEPADVPARPSLGQGGALGVQPDAKIVVNGTTREYRLVAPKSLDATKPVPLAFAFHGLGDSKDLLPWYSRLSKLAEAQGFVLVYPNATNRCWPYSKRHADDDLAFFDALYDSLTKQYNIDLNRVYVLGMSNGGYFSHVIASERCDKVAAIVCHSAGLGAYWSHPIDVKQKYAVLVVHGVDDVIVGVDEGRRVRDAYTKWGHPVEYLEVPNWNHIWAYKQNDAMWAFLLKHPLRPAPAPEK